MAIKIRTATADDKTFQGGQAVYVLIRSDEYGGTQTVALTEADYDDLRKAVADVTAGRA